MFHPWALFINWLIPSKNVKANPVRHKIKECVRMINLLSRLDHKTLGNQFQIISPAK